MFGVALTFEQHSKISIIYIWLTLVEEFLCSKTLAKPALMHQVTPVPKQQVISQHTLLYVQRQLFIAGLRANLKSHLMATLSHSILFKTLCSKPGGDVTLVTGIISWGQRSTMKQHSSSAARSSAAPHESTFPHTTCGFQAQVAEFKLYHENQPITRWLPRRSSSAFRVNKIFRENLKFSDSAGLCDIIILRVETIQSYMDVKEWCQNKIKKQVKLPQ